MRPLLLALGVLACSSTSPPPPGAPGPEPPPPREPAATSAPEPVAPALPAEPPTARPPVGAPTPYSCETDADCVVSSATGTCGPCGGCPQVLGAEEARRRGAAEARCAARRPDPNVHCSDCPPGPPAAACVERRCAPVVASP